MGGHDYTNLIVDRTLDFTGRDWVFTRIAQWLSEPTSSRYFLLGGGPGGGKTALAARLTQISAGTGAAPNCPPLGKNCLAYVHFCQAKNDLTLDPSGTFVRNLSLALSQRYADSLKPWSRSVTRTSISSQIYRPERSQKVLLSRGW